MKKSAMQTQKKDEVIIYELSFVVLKLLPCDINVLRNKNQCSRVNNLTIYHLLTIALE